MACDSSSSFRLFRLSGRKAAAEFSQTSFATRMPRSRSLPVSCSFALESSDFRHLQHLSFAGRGEQCSLKRKETCPRLHSRSALELGLRFRAPFDAYSVSVEIPALAQDGGIYHAAPFQLTLVLTLPLANYGPQE